MTILKMKDFVRSQAAAMVVSVCDQDFSKSYGWIFKNLRKGITLLLELNIS